MKKDDNVKLISRRRFLELTGLSAVGAAAGSLLFSETMAVPGHMLQDEALRKGEETWVNTVCGQCSGGCGIRVRLIDGIPVYIKGNPHYPVNRGGVCPMAHSALEVLFNPDRVRTPLTRNGAKGEAKFKESDPQAVLTALGKRFQSLKAAGRGHKIALINGGSSPLMRSLSRYWLESLGSPNYYETGGPDEYSTAVRLCQGVNLVPAYDLQNSKYILNFGFNFLEEGNSPVYYHQLFGSLRSLGKGAGPEVVHIDSRMNLTAAAADRWVPIRPDRFAALALGIANVLIADELYDGAYIRDFTFGFEDFRDEQGKTREGFKSFVKKNYYPEKAAEITGVPAEVIIKLAEDFGTHQPAVAVGPLSAAPDSGFARWAVYCLNALAGNIQAKGGVYFTPRTPDIQLPTPAAEAPVKESLARPKIGLAEDAQPADVPLHGFFAAAAKAEKGLIDTLIIVDANPLYDSLQKDQVKEALEKIENVVYLGHFIDDTAAYADLILPDHTFLEKNDVSGPVPGVIFAGVGVVQPVVKPLFNTVQAGDALIHTGRAAAGQAAFPWKDYAELVNKRFEAIYKSGGGSVISESVDVEWDRYLKERGWKFQQYENFESFYKLLTNNGGWWDPATHGLSLRDAFHTGSGKFEFFSPALQKHMQTEQVKTDAAEFPLLLAVSQLLTNRAGKGASQPSMMEMVGINVDRHWQSWVEINPETAHKYGLKDRKPARIESAKGRVEVEVRFFPGIHPGVVHIPLGLGHAAFGRYGTGLGVNPLDLVEHNEDPLSHAPALNGTPVKIGPVQPGG